MNIVLEYIKYRWKAKGRHGIHSPFIYDLVDECFRLKVEQSDLRKLSGISKQLSTDQRIIEIEDHGAGSKRLSNQRKIATIFNTSSSNGKYGRLFYQLMRHFHYKQVLELGTSLGVGTMHFSLGNPQANITTIEGCANTAAIARENFDRLGIKNIQLINATFQSYFEENPTLEKLDLVFIDGHHERSATLNYLNEIEPFIHEETLIILDDIRWNNDMFRLWNELVESSAYNVTIDLFRMGIISKRSFQEKEHFILKY